MFDHPNLPPLAFQTAGRGRLGRLTTLWGKGGGAPPPDPRLIDAQIKSLGIQDQAIERMLKMAEDMAPQQRQMMQDTIDRSSVLWGQSQEDRQFALQKRAQLSGIQNSIAQESATFNTEDRRAQLAGQAGADISQTFGMAREQMARDAGRMGINPNDGRSHAMRQQMAAQEALAQATGRNLAGQQATQERRMLQDRANNALAGYPSMTAGSVGVGSGVAGQGMAALNAGQADLMRPSQAIAGMAGNMGTQAGNMWGQQNAAYQADQNADANAFGTAGSTIGSLAMAFAL